MRYHVLACDYDGTLARDGLVDAATVAALERLLATGRHLVLVTGRELEELKGVFPQINLFSRVVAENGALLYTPATKEEKPLAQAPPPEFVRTLRERGVSPLQTGKVIVATWRPHETTVVRTIGDLGLELQVIFNKDAVMVLPSGVNKATGLTHALTELGFTAHEAVGVGDAENDHALLHLCECGVALDNALPALKDTADFVTTGDHGIGVAQLIDLLVDGDLASLEDRLTRHHLLLGHDGAGAEVVLSPHGANLLIAGPSGSGKSTAAASFLERLAEHNYQFCIIDPEGDYVNFEGVVTVGSPSHGPTLDETLQLLAGAKKNLVVNLAGLPLADRPMFFLTLMARIQELWARTGRPHWLIVDEAHHLLPTSWELGQKVVPAELTQTVFITVHPHQVAHAALAHVDWVVAVGKAPQDTVKKFLVAIDANEAAPAPLELDSGEVFLWSRRSAKGKRVKLVPGKTERKRHVRKYAEGELPPDRCFYFRGADGKLNLKAQNLMWFMQLADGVDDATWMFHLRQNDYSTWFRDRLKDAALGDLVQEIEKDSALTPAESRAKIRSAIEKIYTLPASPPLPMPGTDADPKRQAETKK